MSCLLRCQSISLSYGTQPLFEQASFVIHKGDRIAIIGRNGMGKSTLLKLIQQEIEPDSGSLESAKGIKMAMMQQDIPKNLNGTLKDYYRSLSSADEHLIERIISQIGLEETLLLDKASGGQIRRVLLGACLLDDPDILLLDEPTNHMDIDTIVWMESWLLRLNKTIVFITHDRDFMNRLATRILNIDYGQIFSWDGNYNGFLKHKATEEHARERMEDKFDKKLAEEERWIRQGIKARRTRNEGRVRALEAMREERAKRHTQLGNLKVTQRRQEYAGKICFDIENISFKQNDKTIINDFSSLMMRGNKIGVIGPNGCGKTTLFKLLTHELNPQTGHIREGSQLNIAYFDQHRQILDLDLTAMDNVSEGRTHIEINGQSKHIISYLQDFLFTADKARQKVARFSGGERNRLMLAKLLSQPSNFLILDEPSNDLDMETLNLLEEFLVDYPGTLLMASHDRALLNNVVDSLWVFTGDGHVDEYMGDYAQWQSQQKSSRNSQPSSTKEKTTQDTSAKKTPKISYNELRELNKLPAQIEKLEQKITKQNKEMSDNDFYQQDNETVTAFCQQHESLKEELKQAYTRWEELETKKNG